MHTALSCPRSTTIIQKNIQKGNKFGENSSGVTTHISENECCCRKVRKVVEILDTALSNLYPVASSSFEKSYNKTHLDFALLCCRVQLSHGKRRGQLDKGCLTIKGSEKH